MIVIIKPMPPRTPPIIDPILLDDLGVGVLGSGVGDDGDEGGIDEVVALVNERAFTNMLIATV
jgi:hypothetical protein